MPKTILIKDDEIDVEFWEETDDFIENLLAEGYDLDTIQAALEDEEFLTKLEETEELDDEEKEDE